jgi:hypothetical protein
MHFLNYFFFTSFFSNVYFSMFFVWVSRVILSLLCLLPTFPLSVFGGREAQGPAHGVPADHPRTRARLRG